MEKDPTLLKEAAKEYAIYFAILMSVSQILCTF